MLKGDKKRKTRSGSKSQSTVPAFLLKTYEILENPVYNDIISWNREGNAFIVKRINEFSEKVLPKYFKHNNFASFVRQLNMYDFHKSRHENNENEFRHKLFKRGQKHLLADIKRKISEGHVFNNNQVVAVNKDFDIDKFKKEATHFSNELGSVKRHQNDLEKVTKMIYNQNSQLLKENKLLWNELIKNKEKYERKIEKLMLFIFSVMHQSGNQLGPSEGRKSLTNAELSATLGELTGDAEQAKKFLGENENGASSILPDKKDNEQFFQKMSKYLENKDSGDSNLNSLLEQIQNGNIDDLFKHQTEAADEEVNLEDKQNLDPNIDLMRTNNSQLESKRGRRKGRGRRVGSNLVSESNEDEVLKEVPNKFVKTETEPLYGLQQNILLSQEPINMMNQEVTNEPLRRELPSFSLGLSRGPSFNTDMGTLRAPNLIQQKSSTNDFLFSSPKPFMNPLKEDELPELYNVDSFNNKTNEVKGADLAPQNKSDSQLDEAFSPTSFMNNNNQHGFNFGQPFEDTMYRN